MNDKLLKELMVKAKQLEIEELNRLSKYCNDLAIYFELHKKFGY